MLTIEDLKHFGFTKVVKTSDFILLDDVKTNIAKTLKENEDIEEEEAEIEKEIDPEEQKRLDEIKRKQEEQRKRKEAAGFFKVMNEQKAANDFLKACVYSNSEFNVAIISSKSNHHVLQQDKSLYIKRIFTEFEDFDIKMMTVSDLNIPCPCDDDKVAFKDSAVALLYAKNACTKASLNRDAESIDVKRKLLDLATSIGLKFVFKNAYEDGFYYYERIVANLSVNSYRIYDVSDFLIPESQVLNIWIDGRMYKANTCSEFLDELIHDIKNI